MKLLLLAKVMVWIDYFCCFLQTTNLNYSLIISKWKKNILLKEIVQTICRRRVSYRTWKLCSSEKSNSSWYSQIHGGRRLLKTAYKHGNVNQINKYWTWFFCNEVNLFAAENVIKRDKLRQLCEYSLMVLIPLKMLQYFFYFFWGIFQKTETFEELIILRSDNFFYRLSTKAKTFYFS